MNFLLIIIVAGVYSLPNKRDDFGKEPDLPESHPCQNTTVNKTVITPGGEKVLCLVPSEDDLLETLKASGGFNKHYVAISAEEAEANFEDPFHPIALSQNHPKPDWIWSSRINETGRRRRSAEDRKYKLGITTAVSDEDRADYKRTEAGLRSCVRQGARSPQGLVQLCEECWWVKELPDDKFPRFINERICGKDGTSSSPPTGFCNSGNGQCIQRSITQDLLVRTNRYVQLDPSPNPKYSVVYKQIWEPYGQAIRSCCQCQNY